MTSSETSLAVGRQAPVYPVIITKKRIYKSISERCSEIGETLLLRRASFRRGPYRRFLQKCRCVARNPRAFEEMRVLATEQAHDVAKGEVAEVVGAGEAVLEHLIRLRQNPGHVGH